MMSKLFGSLVLSTLIVALSQPARNTGQADLVLLNARILTVDTNFRVAAALAVRDGRFIAIGSNEDVRPHIGGATQVIDGRGRTVVPGLIDTHVHALDVAEAEAAQPFENLQSIDALQAWIRRAVASGPPTRSARSGQSEAWIWTPRVYPTRLREHRFPTRQELDAAAPDRPVAVDGAYAFCLLYTSDAADE